MTRLESLSDRELALRAAMADAQGRRARLAACEAETERRRAQRASLAARMGESAQTAQVTRVMCENTVSLPVPDVMPWHGVPAIDWPVCANTYAVALPADFKVKPRKRAKRSRKAR